jgi:glucose dehydrogenase
VFYDERPQCCGNASCVPLCPIGAKYDASVHATKAEKAGARLETSAVVHRLETDANRRVSGRTFPAARRQRRISRGGRIVVLAAHAIETPKLLLMSRDERTPKGVANSSDNNQCVCIRSALPQSSDVGGARRHFAFVPILLQKSFCTGDRKFF